jgi:two-component system, LytTR family, sensor kinase
VDESSTDRPAPQTWEYSIFGLAAHGPHRHERAQRTFALVVLAIATVFAAMYSLEHWFRHRLDDGVAPPLSAIFPVELVATYLWALLAPLVMGFAQRYPLWGRHPGNWGAHVAGAIAATLLHVTLFSSAVWVVRGDAAGFAHLWATILISWFLVDALVYSALVVASHAVVHYRVSRDRTMQAAELEARLAQAQLQMLRMQLHPHFLFNTLHSISALMHQDVRRADSMIVALSDLLRLSLQNVGAQEVPLQVELDFLQRFTQIMTLRFGDRLRIHMEVDPAVTDARVPNLFLQPLVENSIRHGFGDRVAGGRVDVRITRRDDMLVCEVTDDGRGMPAGGTKEGVGLTSTRARLAHLYGDRHTFQIRSAPDQGVHILMAIPYRPDTDRPTTR